MDWYRWHEGYEGQLQGRLQTVQGQITQAFRAVPPGPVRIISVCAGQGHDIVGALISSERRSDVQARLVELDERNVAAARRRVEAAELAGIDIQQGDAGITDAYDGATPAHVVLLCGVFGSLTNEDIDSTIATLPQLCSHRGQVIWTAHRAATGLFDHVTAAFRRHGFASIWTSDATKPFGVGRHQLVADPQALQPGKRLFRFADEKTLVAINRIKLS